MMNINYKKYIIFLLFFLYIFLVFNTSFWGPDYPVYFAYTASIVEDKDLNIVNQVYSKSDKFNISKSYNLPDFHTHGGVILWVPFYIYGKLARFVVSNLNFKGLNLEAISKSITHCTMSFSTVIFGFLAILLTYFFCRIFFSHKIIIWSIFVMFLGTPFFYYMLCETGNPNMLTSLFSIISIWLCSYFIGTKRFHWFLYGLFFSICIVVKLDIWFQIFFIFSLFIIRVILRQINYTNGIYFIFGLMPGLLLKSINDYLKYGVFHLGEIGLYSHKSCYLFEQLFSSYRGYFYTSPIFYICLLGLIFVIINLLTHIKSINREDRMQDLFFFILALYLIIKIFLTANRYGWGGGTCGARLLLSEFPIFVLLYARILKELKGILFPFCLYILSLVFIFWNLLVTSEYINLVDLGYAAGAPPLNIRVKALKDILYPLFYIKDFSMKLIFLFPIILAILGIAFYITSKFINPISSSPCYIKKQNNYRFSKPALLFIMYCFVSYIAVTTLNIWNNRMNIEKLKQGGFFDNAKIIEPYEFEREENVGSMDEIIEYYRLKNNNEMIEKIKRHKKEIYGDE